VDDLQAFAESELTDARLQRDDWQQRLTAAQAQAQQAQQAAQQAQAMIFKSEGAIDQALAFLKRLSDRETAPAVVIPAETASRPPSQD
jgi:predicted Zn-dependent protease